MNAGRWKPPLGFGLLAAGVLTGAVWLGFGDLVPALQPWFPVVVAVLVITGAAFLFFSRPASAAWALERSSQDIVYGLERQHDVLERIAALPELLRTSLKGTGDRLGDIGQRLDRHESRLEQLAVELAKARRRADMVPGHPAPTEADGATPQLDLGQELKAAWKRYLDQGDGQFSAKGFEDELSSVGIDVDVRSLDGEAKHAVLAVGDPRASDRSFFVLPDFTKSISAAQHWFDDESSGRLGSRIKELRRLARGRWSENGNAEVVEKGSVA